MPTKSPSKPPSFARVTEVPPSGLVPLGSLDMIPNLLVERFGEPSPVNGYKVSGRFIFADERGNVFSIYDWKMTSLYHGSTNSALFPDELWSLDEIVPLQMGGLRNQKSLDKFLSWLDCVLTDGLQTDQEWLAALPAGPCSAEDQDRLMRLMQNGGDKTQIAALEAICRIGEPIATPKLLEKLFVLLELPSPVRPEAIRAISAFAGLSHTSRIQSFLTERLNSNSASERRNGLLTLSALGPGVWSDVTLARFAQLLTEEPTAEVALSAMNWIPRRRNTPTPTPEIVSRVATQLCNPNAKIRRNAAYAVVSLGKAAADFDVLTPLFRMLGEADKDLRLPAEMSFEKMGELAAIPGFLSHLCQSLHPDDFRVKASALRLVRELAKATGEAEAGRRLARIIRNSKSRRQ